MTIRASDSFPDTWRPRGGTEQRHGRHGAAARAARSSGTERHGAARGSGARRTRPSSDTPIPAHPPEAGGGDRERAGPLPVPKVVEHLAVDVRPGHRTTCTMAVPRRSAVVPSVRWSAISALRYSATASALAARNSSCVVEAPCTVPPNHRARRRGAGRTVAVRRRPLHLRSRNHRTVVPWRAGLSSQRNGLTPVLPHVHQSSS